MFSQVETGAREGFHQSVSFVKSVTVTLERKPVDFSRIYLFPSTIVMGQGNHLTVSYLVEKDVLRIDDSLQNLFFIKRHINTFLNLRKCLFQVGSGPFPGEEVENKFENEDFTVAKIGSMTELVTNFGLKVRWDGYMSVKVEVPTEFKWKVSSSHHYLSTAGVSKPTIQNVKHRHRNIATSLGKKESSGTNDLLFILASLAFC